MNNIEKLQEIFNYFFTFKICFIHARRQTRNEFVILSILRSYIVMINTIYTVSYIYIYIYIYHAMNLPCEEFTGYQFLARKFCKEISGSWNSSDNLVYHSLEMYWMWANNSYTHMKL